MKNFFLYVVPFIFPTIIYFSWRYFDVIRSVKEKEYKSPPWAILMVIGAIFAMIFLSLFAINDKAPATAKYEPPKYENGKLIPAKMKY